LSVVVFSVMKARPPALSFNTHEEITGPPAIC